MTLAKPVIDNGTGSDYGVAVSDRGVYGYVQLGQDVYDGAPDVAPLPVYAVGSPANTEVVSVSQFVQPAALASSTRRFLKFVVTAGSPVFIGPPGVTSSSFFHKMSVGDSPFIVDISSGAQALWHCVCSTGQTASLHVGVIN